MGVLTRDSWREWCDTVFWCDEGPQGNRVFQSGDVVFCKIDAVLFFFERLRLTRKRIVLVTGEGDFSCDTFRQNFLPANVVRWFATNVTASHPRVTAYPLGFGSPRSSVTLSAGEILKGRAAGMPRDLWLYVNFRPDTNPAVRQPVFVDFQNRSKADEWITFQPPTGHGTNAEFLEALVRHRFVLCPPGNGVDTHRMWEALLAGAVPVVLRSQAMEPFAHLPVLFVEDFRDITRDLLEAALQKYPQPPEVHPVMTSEFWRTRIREAAAELANNPLMEWSEWTRESLSYGMGMMGRRLRRRR